MPLSEQVNVGSSFVSGVYAGRAITSLLRPHKFSSPEVANANNQLRIEDPVPLEPNTPENTAQLVYNTLQDRDDVALDSELNGSQLIALAAILVQYSDLVPTTVASFKTPYTKIVELQEALAERSEATSLRNTIPDQLSVALDLNDGTLGDALWALFLASRHLSRWADESLMKDVPSFDVEEKTGQMLRWCDNIYAMKGRDNTVEYNSTHQDPSGDLYYAWTYGLYGYASSIATERATRTVGRCMSPLFNIGTDLMQQVVQKRNPQLVPSSHANSTTYGRAISYGVKSYVKERVTGTLD